MSSTKDRDSNLPPGVSQFDEHINPQDEELNLFEVLGEVFGAPKFESDDLVIYAPEETRFEIWNKGEMILQTQKDGSILFNNKRYIPESQ